MIPRSSPSLFYIIIYFKAFVTIFNGLQPNFSNKKTHMLNPLCNLFPRQNYRLV